MNAGRTRGALLFVFLCAGAMGAFAQTEPDNALFLVSRPKLPDPVFRDSVVLMLPDQNQQRGLVFGLIVNKPLRVQLSEIFPGERAFRARTDTLYFGGPVDSDAPSAVFRSPRPPKDAVHLFADLYVSFDRDFILAMLKKPAPSQQMRIFLGRSQWFPEQLRIEMLREAWYTERTRSDAETGWIFSKDPQSVWQIVLDEAKPKTIAGLPAGRTDPGGAVAAVRSPVMLRVPAFAARPLHGKRSDVLRVGKL